MSWAPEKQKLLSGAVHPTSSPQYRRHMGYGMAPVCWSQKTVRKTNLTKWGRKGKMPFSLYSLEGEKCVSISITTQIKPLWALLQLPVPAAVKLLLLQVCEILDSLKPQHVSLSGSTGDSEHIHSCLRASSNLASSTGELGWLSYLFSVAFFRTLECCW